MTDNRYVDFRKQVTKRPAAAALAYDPSGTGAPEVVAAGFGLSADAIVALAKKHNIPLHEDAALVEALARLAIGSTIPAELWQVVAAVLAFIYRIDAAAGKR